MKTRDQLIEETKIFQDNLLANKRAKEQKENDDLLKYQQSDEFKEKQRLYEIEHGILLEDGVNNIINELESIEKDNIINNKRNAVRVYQSSLDIGYGLFIDIYNKLSTLNYRVSKIIYEAEEDHNEYRCSVPAHSYFYVSIY